LFLYTNVGWLFGYASFQSLINFNIFLSNVISYTFPCIYNKTLQSVTMVLHLHHGHVAIL